MDMERKEADKMTIEEARKQKGMSRREVSEWLEIPYRTLSNWETGVRSCPHSVSYTHLDVYKRQHPGGTKVNQCRRDKKPADTAGI